MVKTIRRRRHEGKTDYKARLALLKSEKPRLIIRKTNRYIIAQIVETEIAQDKIILGLSSRALLKKGWPENLKGSLKSLAAAYLTGFVLGSLAKDKVKDIILDAGMHRNIPKSRIYALLKGALDSGLNISHKPEILPSIEQIKTNEKLAPVLDKITSELKSK